MIRNVPLALLIALFLLPSIPLGAGEVSREKEEKIRKLLQKATDHYQKKENEKAIEVNLEILSLIPEGNEFDSLRMRVHYMAAACSSLLRKDEAAILHLEKAIENGLMEMMYLERNPDFTSLRGAKGYATLTEKMVKRRELESRRKMDKLKAFDFSLTTVDGKPIRKKDYLGQVLIVDLWGTWCPPCRMEIPHFIELHKRYGPKGLAIVGLNSERTRDPQEAARLVKKVVEESKIPYPCALVTDAILASVPDLSGYPTTIFFGRDGTARNMEVGLKSFAELEAIVKPLLAEEAPKAALPKAVDTTPGGPKTD